MDSPRLLLIFDIDGTLTESCAVDADCFVQAMVEVLGISGIDTNWERYTHVTDSGIAREISSTMRGCPLSESEESALEAAHFRHLTNLAPESLPPVSGAIEFLDMLGRDGRVRLAIATGC